MSADQEASGSTPLFAVFLLSIISIFLIPYTLYALFGGEDDDKNVVKTWSSKKDKGKSGILNAIVARFRQTFTTKMIIAWTVYILLLWYVSVASKAPDHFDPFEILQLPSDATEADVKRAYRKLSLQYHPDKNPDPAAADYFAQYIAKAYKTLTDETARENYRKYGHPDGPQAVSISVALPEWFFNKDKEAAPAILLTLLLGGIVLPLGLVACYLGRSHKYTGPNEVMVETTQWYMHSPYAIKQFQGVGRLPETFVCAMEFIQMPITADQGAPLEHLRRELVHHYSELKDTSGAFYKKRNQCLVKAHLLLLAHLAREPVPAPLKKDLEQLLQRAPRLMQEMFYIATAPRVRPGYGWLAPAVGTVEMMQCVVQAVSIEEKKKQTGPGKSAEGVAALLQLPHFDAERVRKLQKRKIKSLPELQRLDKAERRVAMQSCGLAGTEVDDVEVALSAMPTIYLSAKLSLDESEAEAGEAGVAVLAEEDVLVCAAHVMLLRPSHQAAGFDPDTVKGTAARAYAPNYPFPRDEHWIFIVADPSNNTVLGWARVGLVEAESIGARYAASWVSKTTVGAAPRSTGGPSLVLASSAGDGDGAPEESEEALVERVGQRIEIKFLAPPPGKHDLALYVMCDSWVGADRAVPLKLRTVEATRAQREGRAAAAAAAATGPKARSKAPSAVQRSEESELALAEDAGDDVSDAGDYSGSEGEGSDDDEGSSEGEHDWDSDEYGTEESGDEDDIEGEEIVSDGEN